MCILIINKWIIKNDLEKFLFNSSLIDELCRCKYEISNTKEITNEFKKLIIDDKNFEKNLDSKPYLMFFNNGVYDFVTFTFRPFSPEDMNSFTLDYDYVLEYSCHIQDLTKCIQDILPDINVKNFMMKLISTRCVNINKEQFATFIIGSGNNGKTILEWLVEITFGNYSTRITNGLLSEEIDQENIEHNYELISLNNKNSTVCCFEDEKINVNTLKLLMGHKSIITRNSHQLTRIEIIPNFKLTVHSNRMPMFDSELDDETKSRVVCIPFNTVFVENPEKENERKIDREIHNKLKLWKQDFMLLLIQFYKLYCIEGLDIPFDVLKFTNECFKK